MLRKLLMFHGPAVRPVTIVLLLLSVQLFVVVDVLGQAIWSSTNCNGHNNRRSVFPAPWPPFVATDVYSAYRIDFVRVSGDGEIYFVEKLEDGSANLVRVDKTGDVSWRWEVPGSSVADMAVDESGTVYLATHDTLYRVEFWGDVAWSLGLPPGSPEGSRHMIVLPRFGDIVIGQMRFPLHDTSFVCCVSKDGVLTSTFEVEHKDEIEVVGTPPPLVGASDFADIYVVHQYIFEGVPYALYFGAVDAITHDAWWFWRFWDHGYVHVCAPICCAEGGVAYSHSRSLEMLSASGKLAWHFECGVDTDLAWDMPRDLCEDSYGNLVCPVYWTGSRSLISGIISVSNSGDQVWSLASADWFGDVTPPVATSDGYVLTAIRLHQADEPSLQCIDCLSGRIVWEYPDPSFGRTTIVPLAPHALLIEEDRPRAETDWDEVLVLLESEGGLPEPLMFLGVETDAARYKFEETMRLAVDLVADGKARTVDLYVALEMAGGAVYFYPSWSGLAEPFLTGIHIPPQAHIEDCPLFTITLPDLPAGTYRWYAACTHAGTTEFASNIASSEWKFSK
ncbi:MAG: hypothetical protein JW759_03955 [Candidatus Coatesbacteria bacterium]|nr:hypothetical protein [Candidatus Coatesbacteria bacterium]